jgi:hypothetical protein
MSFWDIFTLCCWIFIVPTNIHNIRNMRPRPKNKHEVDQLRKEALRLAEEGNSSGFDKMIDATYIKEQKHVEYFRLYVRLGGKYPMRRLTSLVEKLRISRMEYRTSLKSKNLTDAQVGVYMQIRTLEVDSLSRTSGDKKTFKRHARRYTSILLYALKHVDQADAIIAIVEDRDILDLKQIKAFLKDTESFDLGALSEGML